MVILFDSFFFKLWPAIQTFIAAFFVLVIGNGDLFIDNNN